MAHLEVEEISVTDVLRNSRLGQALISHRFVQETDRFVRPATKMVCCDDGVWRVLILHKFEPFHLTDEELLRLFKVPRYADPSQ